MPFSLTPERQETLQDILTRYPNKMAATIPLLHLCQEQNGWVSDEAVDYVATTLELPTAHVFGVVTFYTLFWTHPMGKHHVWVCRTLSCALNGSDEVLERCKMKLGIDVGQTSDDGKFTLVELECLGSCGTAPVALMDEDLHENLTPDRICSLIDQVRDGTYTKGGSGAVKEDL